jgi:predicted nucleotidyltransferase component of viral defense system
MISGRYKDRVDLLLQVLPYVAKEKVFALKGGTAINLFVRNMPRLSVDLDLHYIPIKSRDQSLQETETALGRIKNDLEKFIRGIHVQIFIFFWYG